MAEFKLACLAKSLAGRDQGELYVIIGLEGEYAYLSDGRRRPLERPKRKNRKHLQLMKQCDGDVRSSLTEGRPVRNEEIASFIRTHKQ